MRLTEVLLSFLLLMLLETLVCAKKTKLKPILMIRTHINKVKQTTQAARPGISNANHNHLFPMKNKPKVKAKETKASLRCPKVKYRVKTSFKDNKAMFRCNKKFVLMGVKNATCLPTRKWNRPLPVCITKQCPLIEVSETMIITMKNKGKTLYFKCPDETRLHGTDTIICEGRKWTDEPPTCESITTTRPIKPTEIIKAVTDKVDIMTTGNNGGLLNGFISQEVDSSHRGTVPEADESTTFGALLTAVSTLPVLATHQDTKIPKMTETYKAAVSPMTTFYSTSGKTVKTTHQEQTTAPVDTTVSTSTSQGDGMETRNEPDYTPARPITTKLSEYTDILLSVSKGYVVTTTQQTTKTNTTMKPKEQMSSLEKGEIDVTGSTETIIPSPRSKEDTLKKDQPSKDNTTATIGSTKTTTPPSTETITNQKAGIPTTFVISKAVISSPTTSQLITGTTTDMKPTDSIKTVTDVVGIATSGNTGGLLKGLTSEELDSSHRVTVPFEFESTTFKTLSSVVTESSHSSRFSPETSQASPTVRSTAVPTSPILSTNKETKIPTTSETNKDAVSPMAIPYSTSTTVTEEFTAILISNTGDSRQRTDIVFASVRPLVIGITASVVVQMVVIGTLVWLWANTQRKKKEREAAADETCIQVTADSAECTKM